MNRAVTFLVALLFIALGIALGVLDAKDSTIGIPTWIGSVTLVLLGGLLVLPTNMKAALGSVADTAARFWRPPSPPGGGAP